MKLSIIMPSKNEAEGIAYALESWIRVCEGLDYEIIVVDDSDDETPLIVKKYAEKYQNIKLICGERKGVGAARNLGFKHSTGEIIIWSDADGDPEGLRDEIIEAQRKWINSVLNSFKDDDVDIVVSDHTYCFFHNLIQNIETLRQFNLTSMMAECYRRRVLEDSLIPEEVTVGEDIDLYLKALSKCKKIVKSNQTQPVFASVWSISDVYRRYLWYGREIWNFLKYHKREIYRVLVPILHVFSLLLLPFTILNLLYVLPFITVVALEYIRHLNRLPTAVKLKKFKVWLLIPFLITFERCAYSIGLALGIKSFLKNKVDR